MIPAGEDFPRSVFLSSLLITEFFMKDLALQAECSVSLTVFKSGGGSEGRLARV